MTVSIKASEIQTEDVVLVVASVAVVGAAVAIGSTVASGVATGAISAIGIGFTIWHTRKHAPRLWNMMVEHPLATDVVLDVGVFVLVGSATATGLIAGCSASLFTSLGVTCMRKFGKVPVEPINFFTNPFKPVRKSTQEIVVVTSIK